MDNSWKAVTQLGAIVGLGAGVLFCTVAQFATPINQELMQRGLLLLILAVYLRIQVSDNKRS